MIDAILDAIQSLSQRLAKQEARPYNPYLPDAQMFDHFAGDGTIDARWTVTVAGSGAVTIPNATPTIARLATGATVSSAAQIDWGSNFSLVGANKYAEIVSRFALTAAPIATSVCTIGFVTAAGNFARIGCIGSGSTTNFVVQTQSGAATTTVTTVAIDTSQHLFAVRMFPDRARFYIDNAQVAEHTTNIPTAAVAPRLSANNGATAAAQTMDVDFVWIRESR